MSEHISINAKCERKSSGDTEELHTENEPQHCCEDWEELKLFPVHLNASVTDALEKNSLLPHVPEKIPLFFTQSEKYSNLNSNDVSHPIVHPQKEQILKPESQQ